MMASIESNSVFNHGEIVRELLDSNGNDLRPTSSPVSDQAIDSALRSVPLPDGLLTRLGQLIYALADGTADPANCLGC
jgi:hypothetical protein